MGRSYGTPEVDEDDLAAELDALGDEIGKLQAFGQSQTYLLYVESLHYSNYGYLLSVDQINTSFHHAI